jgi:hypothetical protein
MINGKNNTKRNMTIIQAVRCYGACMAAINTTVPVESSVRLWSDKNAWPNATLPKAGDNIVIPPEQSWIFDLEESPAYNYIQINGKVNFK